MVVNNSAAEATTTRQNPSPRNRPAGFWIRFAAAFVDGMAVSALRFPITMAFIGAVALVSREGGEASTEMSAIVMALYVLNALSGPVILYLYAGFFLTSRGATPGKMLFKLRVVDSVTGTNLSWGAVAMRDVVGKLAGTVLFLAGFIMAGFRADKRALHDLMAGSQVIYKD